MSLVSDALKKAQRTRQGDGLGSNVGSASRGQRFGKASLGQKLALAAAAFVAIVAVVVAVTISLLQPDPGEIAARINAARESAAPAASNRGNLDAPSNPPPANSVIVLAPLPRAEAAPAAGNVAAAALSTQPLANAAAQPGPAPQPAVAANTPVRASVPQDPRVLDFLDRLSVIAVRVAGTDSRVLAADNKVFRINDVLDRTLGIRLTEISPTTLTFADAAGAVYTKNHQ